MNEEVSTVGSVEQKQDFDSKLKILLAEDLEMNSTLFVEFLERKGLSCDVTVNGEAAVSACGKKNYDIIFMDCQMPVMDGYEATRRIRAYEGGKRHAVIIALTAYSMRDDRDRCLEAGMDDYLRKPFKFGELEVMLEKYGRYASGIDNNMADADYFSEAVAVFMEESGFDKETCVEILHGFCEHAQRLICEIEDSINSDNFENARVLLQQLKGSSGNVRAKEISRLAFEAEVAIRVSDNNKLRSIVEEAKKILDILSKKV